MLNSLTIWECCSKVSPVRSLSSSPAWAAPSAFLHSRSLLAPKDFCGPPLNWLSVSLVLGPQNWDAAPGGASPEQSRGGESPLSTAAMLLWVQPRIWLTFWAMISHVWPMEILFTHQPAHIFIRAAFSPITPSLYQYQGLPSPRCSILHLALLNLMRFLKFNI